MRTLILFFFLIIGTSANLKAQKKINKKISVSITSTYSSFEQQVKQEVGAVKGDLLSKRNEFTLQLEASYRFHRYFSVGWYFQTDFGTNTNGIFTGFDSTGATTTKNMIGGNYSEFWSGPLMKVHHKNIFLELGYGLIGNRRDKGRNDLLNSKNESHGYFSTSPSVAWFVGGGGDFKLHKNYYLVIKAYYRIRYYTTKNNQSLKNNIVHGTQNFSPLVGVKYVF